MNSMSKVHAIELDHIVLNVEDVERSVSFYTELMGFGAERLAEYRRGEVLFPSVRINASTLIDIFPPKMWKRDDAPAEGRVNMNHFCIALSFDDWKELRKRLETAGVEFHRDRTVNFGARGDGISMYFFDPDGNEIEARYYENLPGFRGAV